MVFLIAIPSVTFWTLNRQDMANFVGIQHIGEKIFDLVPIDNILSNRGVCKSWKQILDNPMLWLKKLSGMGLNEKSKEDYLILIKKTSEAGFQQERIGYLLLIKYIKVTIPKPEYQHIDIDKLFPCQRYDFEYRLNSMRLFLVDLPLLYFALIPKVPDLQLIKFMAKTEKDLLVVKCPLRSKYVRGNFSWFSCYPYPCETNPLQDAIEGNHESKVVKILLKTLHRPANSLGLVERAVRNQNLKTVKLLTRDNTIVPSRSEIIRAIMFAISMSNVDILRHLISKTDTPNGYDWNPNSTPLHAIARQCTTKSEVHNCIEMAKLILSKNIQNINTQCSVMHMLVGPNIGPCQIELISLIAPLSDLNIKNCQGITAIEKAKQNGMNFEVEFLTNFMTLTKDGDEVIFLNKKRKIM